eukprot:scaffold39012_cov191-Amphora_coffeaeformis.AAC.5
MAGAFIVMSGWAAISTGSIIGSLAYACLPNSRFRDVVAVPDISTNTTWFVILGSLLAVNQVRAIIHNLREDALGHNDIGRFPWDMYVEGLAVMGYGLSVYMAHAFFQRWNNISPDNLPLRPLLLDVPPHIPAIAEGGEGGMSRGWCSLCSAALCIVPIPISGPLAFIYVMFMVL